MRSWPTARLLLEKRQSEKSYPRLDNGRGRLSLDSWPPSFTDSEASKCRNQLRHAQAVPLEDTLTSLE